MSQEFDCIYRTTTNGCDVDISLSLAENRYFKITTSLGTADGVNDLLGRLGKSIERPSEESYELFEAYQNNVAKNARDVLREPRPILEQRVFCAKDNSCPWRRKLPKFNF